MLWCIFDLLERRESVNFFKFITYIELFIIRYYLFCLIFLTFF